ncbi:hypothetical protein V2J09_010843 [Rumex salicifolius]
MSLLLESAVGGSATDLDGVLSTPLDSDHPARFLGRTGCMGDQNGLAGGADGGRMGEREFQSGLNSVRFKVAGSDEASSESSSIGAPDDSDEEETGSGDDEDEVQSTLSLDALEESLPIKKGLSSCYAGRSKSFGNLADVKSVNDVQKSDNPFNKRRRNLLAYKLSSWSTSSTSSPSKRRMMINDNRSSFYGHRNPISMPLLPLHEHDDDDEDDDDEDDDYKDDMDNHGGSASDLRRSGSHLGLNTESRFYEDVLSLSCVWDEMCGNCNTTCYGHNPTDVQIQYGNKFAENDSKIRKLRD